MGKQKRKLQPLIRIAVRLAPETWRKVGYSAARQGVQRAEVLRRLIGDAVKGERPPENQESTEIQGPAGAAERWKSLADRRGQTVGEFMAEVLAAIERKLGA